jgi:YidC/Oxa1 family membrane protein insertase
MDKKNTVIGVLLLAAAFAAMQFAPKPPPPAPPPAAPVSTSAAPTGAVTPTTSSPVVAPAVVSASATTFATPVEAASGTITTLANEYIEVRFTNSGGAIRDVALKKYPAVQGKPEPFVFNQIHSAPMLAFVDHPTLNRETVFELVSQTPTEIVYRAVIDGTFEVTRRYVLSPNEGKTTDPYQLRHETTFRNLTDKAFPLPRLSLALGTVGPATQLDAGQHTATAYASGDDYTLVPRTSLDRGYGFMGFGIHEPRPPVANAANIHWASVKNQFFASIITPTTPASGLLTARVPLRAVLPQENENNAHGIAGVLQFDLKALDPQGSSSLAADFYVGPKEYDRLDNTQVFKADQDRVMEFGFFKFFSQLLYTLMIWFHDLVSSEQTSRANWGIAIILTTLALKIATLPLTLKASKSMKRMQKLAPEMKLINEKYKDNVQKKQAAIMELYKQHKVNPLGGCIPMLIPMPFFFGFFTMLQSTAELRFAPFLWAPDLSMPDTVAVVFGVPINIFPLLLAATMIVQMQLTPTINMDKAQAAMMKFMPVVFMVICYNFSCALSLYSTVNGLFTIGQQIYINRMKDDGDPTPAINDRLKNVTPKKKKN